MLSRIGPWALLLASSITPTMAQPEDEDRVGQVSARFLSLREKNPRRGTPLARV